MPTPPPPPTTPRILVSPPDYFGVEYEINPWMNTRRPTDHELAVRQWTDLTGIFRSLGAELEVLPPVDGLPDLVFTANAGVVFKDTFIPSRFRHSQRQGEEEHFCRWFADHGWTVTPLTEDGYFEGAGDALFCGGTLYAGYLHRSDVSAHQEVGRVIDRRVLAAELVDPRFYHLDTCFCPLAPGVAMYYPPAFDVYGQKVLQETVGRLIAVPEADAESFGCNAVVLGMHVVLNTGTDALCALLEREGFTPHPTPLSEFLKAGGAAKCLTLRLDGEEAADW